jgi:hypothetical protein
MLSLARKSKQVLISLASLNNKQIWQKEKGVLLAARLKSKMLVSYAGLLQMVFSSSGRTTWISSMTPKGARTRDSGNFSLISLPNC